MKRFFIDPDITKAETLPPSFYKDESIFEQMKEDVFAKSWQWLGDAKSLVPLDNYQYPFFFMENYIHEPLLLVRDSKSEIRCMSNVCTHRGNLVTQNPGLKKGLTCMYHGRKWDMKGQFKFMPEFEEAKHFPRECDNLLNFKLEQWGPFLFTSLDPETDFSTTRSFLNKYVGFLPLNEFYHDPVTSKDYLVNCHWSLYCDNYLEGFHIPFVHPDLNAVLDYDTYQVELFENGTLQIGFADGAEETYSLPKDHPCYGKDVAAFYIWIFPNIMLNFYPWGLSINIIKPISSSKTKVSFITFLHGENRFEGTASKLMDKVEREDEFVVESVHQGLRSRFYKAGRFSPSKEQGVHHFHKMLAERL